jgi:hypothetical protein
LATWTATGRPCIGNPHSRSPNYNALPFEQTESYPKDGQVIETPQYQAIPATFKDVLFIRDHQVSTWTGGGFLRLTIASLEEPSPEVSAGIGCGLRLSCFQQLLVQRGTIHLVRRVFHPPEKGHHTVDTGCYVGNPAMVSE